MTNPHPTTPPIWHKLVCRKLRAMSPDRWRGWLLLPPAHARLPDETDSSEALLARLLALSLLAEAVRLIAYGLPEREAVWWSCMCVRHTLPGDAEGRHAAELAAIEAAEAWVRQPDNTSRRTAALCAAAAGDDAPGTWSALGAAWSHRLHSVPTICGGRGTAKAIELAARRGPPDQARARLRRFIGAGIEIGNGGAGRLVAEVAA